MSWTTEKSHDSFVAEVAARIGRIEDIPDVDVVMGVESSSPSTGVITFRDDVDNFVSNIVVTLEPASDIKQDGEVAVFGVRVLHHSTSLGSDRTGEWSVLLYPSSPTWVVSERLSVVGDGHDRSLEFSAGLGARHWMRRVVDAFAADIFSNAPTNERNEK